MKGAWFLVCNLVILFFITANCQLSDDDDHSSILQDLRGTFKIFRKQNQFGVIYLAPPNATAGHISYVPRPPNLDGETGIVFPEVTQNMATFPNNYAVATPDYRAVVYGAMMDRQRTIHTEDLFLNLVYPRMMPWYTQQYNRNPTTIYIFTHFLPCPNCFELIQNHVNEHHQRVYVGYTDLYGGSQERGDRNRQIQTRQRRDEITNFLNDNRGGLFQLDIQNACPQRGHYPSRFKRALLNEVCPASTKDREFIIALDFSSGKAEARFSNLPAHSHGWIGLFDYNNKRLNWQWTYNKPSGKINMDYYLSEGNSVKYFTPDAQASPFVTSYMWDSCGHGWTELKSLPASYNGISIKIEIENGYPQVLILFGDSPQYYNSWDWIALQSIDDISSNKHWSYQWVSKIKTRSSSGQYKFSRLDSTLARGFRLKYVYYDGTSYQWTGLYDNATPLWTPDGCRGTI